MVCHIFWPKAKRSKAAHGKEAAGARARNAVEDLNGRCLASLRDEEGSRLSHRRYSCAEGRPWVRCRSGVSQTRYRSDFKRTWVRLGERGRRDRLGARRGESLFSLICID